MDSKNNNRNDGNEDKEKIKVNLENVIKDISEPYNIIYNLKDLLNRVLRVNTLVQHMKKENDSKELISMPSIRR